MYCSLHSKFSSFKLWITIKTYRFKIGKNPTVPFRMSEPHEQPILIILYTTTFRFVEEYCSHQHLPGVMEETFLDQIEGRSGRGPLLITSDLRPWHLGRSPVCFKVLALWKHNVSTSTDQSQIEGSTESHRKL